mgnify:CR=1 FL=1
MPVIENAPEQGATTIINNINTSEVIITNPVDGLELFEDIKSTYNRYMALQDGQAEVLTLWTLFSHTISAFSIAPKMIITSPEKRCGKTTLLDMMNGLVKDPMMTSNITPAAMFRAIDKIGGTVMIDEADTFIRSNPEINGIINCGHRRSSAYVIRTTGDNHEPRQFSTWAPMVIAMIGKPADTIRDRSIEIELKRKTDTDSVERFIFSKVSRELASIKPRIAQWAEDNIEALQYSDPDMPNILNDRAIDNWTPLIAIADAIHTECGEKAREIALELSTVEEEQTPETQLLSDIQDIFSALNRDTVETDVLLENLYETEDGLWAEWNRGKELTAKQLAQKLKPFGIKPKKFRDGNRTPRGYERKDFEDAFNRYLDCSVNNRSVPLDVPCRDNSNPLENNDCSSVPSNISEVGLRPSVRHYEENFFDD